MVVVEARNLLEMQILGTHPRLNKSEALRVERSNLFWQAFQGIPMFAEVWDFRKRLRLRVRQLQVEVLPQAVIHGKTWEKILKVSEPEFHSTLWELEW